MCIGFWSVTHPEYSLVLCTNRDEYLSRPTEPAHWHSFQSLKNLEALTPHPDADDNGHNVSLDGGGKSGFVLSGVDIHAGGTWFGINRKGDVALLTNITEPASKFISSRGHLCSSFLLRNMSSTSQDETLSQFVDGLTNSESRYAGFNMLLLAPEHIDRSKIDGRAEPTIKYDAAILSNGGAGGPIRHEPLSDHQRECGCISNDTMTGFDAFTGLITDAEWPKAIQGRHLFSTILKRSEGETEGAFIEQLFNMLRETKNSPPSTRQDFQETIMVDAVDLPSLRNGASFAQRPRNAVEIPQTDNATNAQSRGMDRMHGADVPISGTAKYYATRLASILLVRKDGKGLFVERDIWINRNDDTPQLVKQEQYLTNHERRYSFQIS